MRLAECALMGLVASGKNPEGLCSSDLDPTDSNRLSTVKGEQNSNDSTRASDAKEEKSVGVDFRGALDSYL